MKFEREKQKLVEQEAQAQAERDKMEDAIRRRQKYLDD